MNAAAKKQIVQPPKPTVDAPPEMDVAITVGKVGEREWEVSLTFRGKDGKLAWKKRRCGKSTATGLIDDLRNDLKFFITWGKLPNDRGRR